MTEPPDLLSVVIPTHNRCDALRRTLDALERQDLPAPPFEVIVVLDGCTDGTPAMLATYAAPFRLLAIDQPQQGPGAARNHGAAKASGRLLLFLDDDVIPSPGCLAAHRAAHRGRHDHVVIGPYLPALRPGADYAEMALRAWWHDKFRAMRHPAHHFGYEDCLSGNCSMSRDLFTRAGGFDAAFPCAHEDYELGVRLLKAGATLRCHATATAIHDIGSSCAVPQMLLRTRREALGDILLGKHHPELRPILPVAFYGEPRTRLNRWMHWLAFSHPGLGDGAASLLGAVLTVLQKLQLRRRWQRLYTGLTHYSYLRGLAEALGTAAALRTFLEDRLPDPPAAAAPEELQIDLRHGIAQAVEEVDRHRPQGVRLMFGRQVIGRIAPRPGREPLRGIHLRSVLATDFLWPLFTATVSRLGLEQAAEIPNDPVVQDGAHSKV